MDGPPPNLMAGGEAPLRAPRRWRSRFLSRLVLPGFGLPRLLCDLLRSGVATVRDGYSGARAVARSQQGAQRAEYDERWQRARSVGLCAGPRGSSIHRLSSLVLLVLFLLLVLEELLEIQVLRPPSFLGGQGVGLCCARDSATTTGPSTAPPPCQGTACKPPRTPPRPPRQCAHSARTRRASELSTVKPSSLSGATRELTRLALARA